MVLGYQNARIYNEGLNWKNARKFVQRHETESKSSQLRGRMFHLKYIENN